jgi:hypothetical protein
LVPTGDLRMTDFVSRIGQSGPIFHHLSRE